MILNADADLDTILEIIDRDAAVVIDNVLSEDDLIQIKNELQPYLNNDIEGENSLDFKPH